MEDSWLYLHPTQKLKNRIEGPSSTFKEAMLMELQIISTDIGGVSELKYINFVKPTVDDIRETIQKLEKKHNIIGREFIRDNYNVKLCVDLLEKSINDYP